MSHKCARNMVKAQGVSLFPPMECVECREKAKKGKRVKKKKSPRKSQLSRVHSMSPRDESDEEREIEEENLARWWWLSDTEELQSDLIDISPLQKIKRYRSRSVPHNCAKMMYSTLEFPVLLEKPCIDYVVTRSEGACGDSSENGDMHCARCAPPRRRRRRTIE